MRVTLPGCIERRSSLLGRTVQVNTGKNACTKSVGEQFHGADLASMKTAMLPPDEFDRIVESALRCIPKRFRSRMQNVAIVVELEPPRPGLLGLYQGRPLTNRSVLDSIAMPDRITIYQGPHERMARTRAELEQIVADTVWHEIAHHFGMDEPRVRRAEWLRSRRLAKRRE